MWLQADIGICFGQLRFRMWYWRALTAFGGLGLEALYAYLLEPIVYGCEMQDWNAWQVILHWTITCITWGVVYHVYLINKREGRFRSKRTSHFPANDIIYYRRDIIHDLPTGESDSENIQKTLNIRSQQGCRLHTIYTNEIGKNSIVGINATINQTILIFERCIKA